MSQHPRTRSMTTTTENQNEEDTERSLGGDQSAQTVGGASGRRGISPSESDIERLLNEQFKRDMNLTPVSWPSNNNEHNDGYDGDTITVNTKPVKERGTEEQTGDTVPEDSGTSAARRSSLSTPRTRRGSRTSASPTALRTPIRRPSRRSGTRSTEEITDFSGFNGDKSPEEAFRRAKKVSTASNARDAQARRRSRGGSLSASQIKSEPEGV